MPLVDFAQLKNDLSETLGVSDVTDKDVISAAMFPKEFENFYRFRQEYGPVDKLDTPTFFVGPNIANEIQVHLFSLNIYVTDYFVNSEVNMQNMYMLLYYCYSTRTHCQSEAQQFWRWDLCCCKTTSLELSAAQSQTVWAVTRPLPAVAEDIEAMAQCELFFNCAK